MITSIKWGLFIIVILLKTISFAHASGDSGSTGTRGGGNPLTLKSKQIEMLVESKELKVKLKIFLENFKFSEIEDQKLRASIIKIYSGLFQDIDKSQYQNNDSCLDNEGRERGASTRNGILGDKICFSPLFLANNQTTLSDLIGITVHEHARHLGFRDEDHTIASFFAKSYEQWVNKESVKELIEEALVRCNYKKHGQLYRFFRVYRQHCNCMKNKQDWARLNPSDFLGEIEFVSNGFNIEKKGIAACSMAYPNYQTKELTDCREIEIVDESLTPESPLVKEVLERQSDCN